MSKKIIISAVASMAVAGGLFAATATGPGSSTITAGSDINGTVHSAKIASATTTLYASDSNVTSAANVGDANYAKFITYVPNIAVGSGNLITIKVNNGAILSNSGNELWLVDANSTAEQNATGAPVVAKMTDYVDAAGNYGELTFKFLSNVASGSELVLVNEFDTNATLIADLGADYGLGARRATLGLVVNSGLACAENVTLEVINSKDQSADWFNVPNTAGKSSTGVTVSKGVYITQAVGGDNNTAGTNGDNGVFTTGECPTYSCTISIASDEKAFGSVVGASTTSCPTCTSSTTTTDLTCEGSFLLTYNSTGLIPNGGITLTSIDVTTNANVATMGELTSVVGNLNDNATSKTFTIASDNKSATGVMNSGLATAGNNDVKLTYTAKGTTVISPAKFDAVVKVQPGSATVDTITDFMEFKEQGTALGVSYLSANPDYRSFVRVTSSAAASAIQAVVTTEDGTTSARVNITKADGTAVSIGANGGAVVVEAADVLRSAQDAGFTGTGMRFNATLYVKTTGTVDAVAFGQTASGSQRYLPVNGATGGKK